MNLNGSEKPFLCCVAESRTCLGEGNEVIAGGDSVDYRDDNFGGEIEKGEHDELDVPSLLHDVQQSLYLYITLRCRSDDPALGSRVAEM